MLTEEEYRAVRAQLDFRPSPWLAAATVAMNLATLAAGIALLQVPGPAAYLGAQVVLAIGFFQAFAILHECGHGSFSRNLVVDTVVGHVASLFCFIPFQSWKYIHQQHHVWAGHFEMDPGVRGLHLWRASGRVPLVARLAWRSWLPIVALMQIANFWSYPLRMKGPGQGRRRLRCALSVMVLFAGLAGLGAAVVLSGIVFRIGLAVGLYLFVTELVNLPHHADFPTHARKLALREQAAIARSCAYPPVVSELLMLNFNFHLEHHMLPQLPWYRIRAARRVVKPLLGERYHEDIAMGWNLSQRTRDIRDVMLVTPKTTEQPA